MSAIDEKALADLLERLEAGCQRTGEGDNGEELFDVEGASDTMWDAALALRALATPEAGASEPVAWRGRINTVIKEEGSNGAACGWQACTGCHETNEGYETGDYSFSKTFGCYVGSGCSECGGLGVVWEHISASGLAEMERDHPAPVDGEAVLVPRHPTPEMLGAWYRYKSGHHFLDETAPADTSDVGAYAAMLAAAPSARKEP
jgi:hypothetical protein